MTEDRCRKNLEEALADCMVMALRLLGESDRTFSPECAEVMARWGPKALEELGSTMTYAEVMEGLA